MKEVLLTKETLESTKILMWPLIRSRGSLCFHGYQNQMSISINTKGNTKGQYLELVIRHKAIPIQRKVFKLSPEEFQELTFEQLEVMIKEAEEV